MQDGIDVELKEIREMLASLCSDQREHLIEQRSLKEDVAQIRRVLIDGNGQPPMTVRMALAENEIRRVAEERQERKLPRSAWAGILVSGILGVLSVVLTIIKMSS